MKRWFIGGLLLAGLAAFAGTCTLQNTQLTQIGNYDTYAGEIHNDTGTNFLQHNVVVAFTNASGTVVDTQTVTPCLRTLQNGTATYFSAQSTQLASTTVNAIARLEYGSSLVVGTATTGSGTISNLSINRSGTSLTVTGTFENTDSTLLQAPNACAVVYSNTGKVLEVKLDQTMSDLSQYASDTFSIPMTVPNDSSLVSYVNVYVDGIKNGVPIRPITDLNNSVGMATLAFIQQPGSAYTNSIWGLQPIVAIQSNNITQTSWPSTLVTLSISSSSPNYGYGTLNCSSGNSVYTVSGTATFSGCNISGLSSASTYQFYITATATLNGTTVTVSSVLLYVYAGTPTPVPTSTPVGTATPTVTPGPAYKLVFTTQPSATASLGGSIGTVAVSLEDYSGNVISADNSDTVTLTLNPALSGGPGTLAGCTGSGTVTLSFGTATFSGCNITGTAGTFTLHATTNAGAMTADSTLIAVS